MNGKGTLTQEEFSSTDGAHIRYGQKSDVTEEGYIHINKPRTHDILKISSHVSIERLGSDINDAVQAVWPKRHQIRYNKAHVLFLSWEDDDLGVKTEIEDLWHVFEKRYGFQVEEYRISCVKPIKNVQQRIYRFLELDGKDALLVFYYAGHARPGMQSNEGSIWFANRHDPSIALPSGGVQSLLEEADADVLLLYDCCHSASTPTCHLQLAKGGVTESIAACGFGDIAAEVDEHSFTKALIKIPTLASTQAPFTIGDLHARVMSQLKCWSPLLLRDHEGNPSDRLEPGRRKTPIYSILSETKPRRSIVIGALPLPSAPSSTNDEGSTSSPSIDSTTSTTSVSSCERPSKKRKKDVPEDGKCAQVLISVRVDQSNLKREHWVNWIREMPPEGKEVHVEGYWASFSSLVLLPMPIAVWNLLADNEAYDFVGFVTSDNLVDTITEAEPSQCSCSREHTIQPRSMSEDGSSVRSHPDTQLFTNEEALTKLAPGVSLSRSRDSEIDTEKRHAEPSLHPDQLAVLSLGPGTPSSVASKSTQIRMEDALEGGSGGSKMPSNSTQSASSKMSWFQQTARPSGLPNLSLSPFSYAAIGNEAATSLSVRGSALTRSLSTKAGQGQIAESKAENSEPSPEAFYWPKAYEGHAPASDLQKKPHTMPEVAEMIDRGLKSSEEAETSERKPKARMRNARSSMPSNVQSFDSSPLEKGSGLIYHCYWIWTCVCFSSIARAVTKRFLVCLPRLFWFLYIRRNVNYHRAVSKYVMLPYEVS